MKVAYCDGHASVTIAGKGIDERGRAEVRQHVGAAVRLAGQRAREEIVDVHVEFTEQGGTSGVGAPSAPSAGARRGGGGGAGGGGGSAGHQEAAPMLPGVGHVIAVGAGKGGVGKSTVAVNLAVGLAKRGHAVGLLDGDIYGPSLPTMLGLSAIDPVVIEGRIQPFYVHGVKAMTIGKLVEPDKPLIWRGPMAHGAFKQLVEQTQWGELDYLIIDLPPGTGDVSLTMAQVLRLTGAVVVCTPQKVAQDDAVRAVKMFQQLGIEVLGVVENMSYFIADDVTPAREYDIFGRGGAQMMAQRLNLPFLGAVPISVAMRRNGDEGEPLKNFSVGAAGAREIEEMVTRVEGQVAMASLRQGRSRPTLRIS
ncbi:MAG: Mrp/NBP35 family ATP-binding protein [Phycisphaerales bacterium]|nr:Mrp/NBP35 family ATP-binding protein [Phycisphaerales bacterium]